MQECQDILKVSPLNVVLGGSGVLTFCQENDQEVGRPRAGFFGGEATCHPTNGATE